jgi:hypothetical protein
MQEVVKISNIEEVMKSVLIHREEYKRRGGRTKKEITTV